MQPLYVLWNSSSLRHLLNVFRVCLKPCGRYNQGPECFQCLLWIGRNMGQQRIHLHSASNAVGVAGCAGTKDKCSETLPVIDAQPLADPPAHRVAIHVGTGYAKLIK